MSAVPVDTLNDPALVSLLQEAYHEGLANEAGLSLEAAARRWQSSATMARTEFIPDLTPPALALMESAYVEGCADSGGGLTPDASWSASRTAGKVTSIEAALAEARAREAQEFSTAMQEILSGTPPAHSEGQAVTGASPAPATEHSPAEVGETPRPEVGSDRTPEAMDACFRILSHRGDQLELEVSIPASMNMMIAQMAAANDQTIQEFLAVAMDEYLTRRAKLDSST